MSLLIEHNFTATCLLHMHRCCGAEDDFHFSASMKVRATASTYAAVALDMAQVLPSPKAEPSCQSLSRPQTHKDKGRAPPEERVQEGCSSDEGEPDRAGQIVADAELCEELQRVERRQAHDVTTAAAAAAAAATTATAAATATATAQTFLPAAAAATAATAANVTFTTGSDAAAHTVDAFLAALATATAQTFLPAGTYQLPPPLPWDVCNTCWHHSSSSPLPNTESPGTSTRKATP